MTAALLTAAVLLFVGPSAGTVGGDRPVGWLEEISLTSGDGVRLRGWAFDPQSPTSPLTVRVYVDDQWHSAHVADKPRPDVARAHPTAGERHGLDVEIAVPRDRTRRICLWAIDHGGGSDHLLLGCQLLGPFGPGEPVPFSGRGWGHGRGMGQWGALGYAVDHGWSTSGILNHFYGGTYAGTAPNKRIDVRVTGFSGGPVAMRAPRGELRIPRSGVSYRALRFRTVHPNGRPMILTEWSTGCGGPWKPVAFPKPTSTLVSPPVSGTDDIRDDIQLCELAGGRHYGGEMRVLLADGRLEVVNSVGVEAYLRGVVPREMPPSWGAAGGGRGARALEAQAVAARSYAHSEVRASWHDTCDTVACQVYLGRGFTGFSGYSSSEPPSTDAAIANTAGQVRRFRSNGRIARTEFSSSTGGHTAGGTFPAVVDSGDDTATNPHRGWTMRLAPREIADRYGRSGDLIDVTVLSRDGNGADGGRVTQVRLRFTDGEVIQTGEQVRSRLGLKSAWFRIG